MKHLICGDIHGNLPALELVLQAEKNNFDQLICHGDVVNYGPWSNECVELLESLPWTVLLRGNHEEYFIQGAYPGQNEIAKAFFQHCFPKFEKQEIIKRYGLAHQVNDFTVQHTLFHKNIYQDTAIESLDKNYIIGHSHQQYDRFIGNKRLINTGSIGQNRSQINCINYILFEEKKQKIELKSILYDIQLVIQQMKADNYPTICMNYYLEKLKK